jgi:hypothetical protein
VDNVNVALAVCVCINQLHLGFLSLVSMVTAYRPRRKHIHKLFLRSNNTDNANTAC